MQIDKPYLGKWRITEMELWDREYIDLMGPGRLTIKTEGDGELQFGAIEAWIDGRVEQVGGMERLEFSFEGGDEGDPVCGRAWAQVAGKVMTGRIYLHMGDDSSFTATRL